MLLGKQMGLMTGTSIYPGNKQQSLTSHQNCVFLIRTSLDFWYLQNSLCLFPWMPLRSFLYGKHHYGHLYPCSPLHPAWGTDSEQPNIAISTPTTYFWPSLVASFVHVMKQHTLKRYKWCTFLYWFREIQLPYTTQFAYRSLTGHLCNVFIIDVWTLLMVGRVTVSDGVAAAHERGSLTGWCFKEQIKGLQTPAWSLKL